MRKRPAAEEAQIMRRRAHHGFAFRYSGNTPEDLLAVRLIARYIDTGNEEGLPVPTPYAPTDQRPFRERLHEWYEGLPTHLKEDACPT